MFKKLLAYSQYLLPQHLLTKLIGYFANVRTPFLKNAFINNFIKIYHVEMHDAVIEDPTAYASFNDFFIRQYKSSVRPIAAGDHAIACPIDGTVAQMGKIQQKQLLQAKNFYFNLDTLLGNDLELSQQFYDGAFTTLYLAPHNYHRVHMPIAGKLIKTIYVPGSLFSVNRITSEIVPQLFSRNERLICIFETDAGLMSVIFVGALIVGSIKTTWMEKPIRANEIITQTHSMVAFNKGDELGYFKLGSTVILLFQPNKIEWLANLEANTSVKFGELIGNIHT